MTRPRRIQRSFQHSTRLSLLLCWWIVTCLVQADSSARDDARNEPEQIKNAAALTVEAEQPAASEKAGSQKQASRLDGSNDPENLTAQLQALQQQAEETLQRHVAQTEVYQQFEQQLAVLKEQNQQLELREQQLMERTASLDALIRNVNAIQLQQLASQLNESVHQTWLLQDTVSEASIETPSVSRKDVVSLEELERTLDPEEILLETDGALASWLRGVIRTEVSQYEASSQDSSSGCVTPLEAARLVQTALFEYEEVNQVDLAQGASIVYEMTSDTYQPPPDPSQTLGQVWWRRYIPEDWERLLPSGWEDWPATLPSYVRHTFGIKSVPVLPPEAVFDRNTHPGSCWPMRGHRGQLTFRLPYSINVEAVTVDHASSLLVPDRSSAPKTLRIVGYPACDTPSCQGIGFDVNQRRLLATTTYDLEAATSVQTFPVLEKLEDDEDPGSCSKTAASCGALPDPTEGISTGNRPGSGAAVSAITVEILDNWGLEEYTCLYRFRVHGIAAV